MFVRNLLMMAGAAVMLFVTSWKLALLVLLGVPATLVPILLLGRRVRRLSRSSQDRVADVSVYVDERSEEHTSELQSRPHLVCRLLLEKKKKIHMMTVHTGDVMSLWH